MESPQSTTPPTLTPVSDEICSFYYVTFGTLSGPLGPAQERGKPRDTAGLRPSTPFRAIAYPLRP
jgi:hypothetical protein